MITYLTFFDRNYCARGSVMIDSLRAVVPEARIMVFALDGETETLLDRHHGRDVHVLPPDFVASRWPNVDRLRATRTHWEYTAMRKPCLMRSVLKELLPPGDLLFYVDADTEFFASPEPALVPMRTASIGLSPHGFSREHRDLVRFGVYNAGCIVLRNDEIARTCMREWADDCFRWCHARVEGHRFMNQGYLSRWPSRYPAVAELRHPGLNLAPWNVSDRRLEMRDGTLTVDAEPLIFYHFHDTRRVDGTWRNSSVLIGRDRQPEVFGLLYDPYAGRMKEAETRLAAHGFDPDAPMRGKYDAAV